MQQVAEAAAVQHYTSAGDFPAVIGLKLSENEAERV